jgi:hypothetical protein
VLSAVWAGPRFDREIATPTGLAGWVDPRGRAVSAWSIVTLDADLDGASDLFVVHDPSDPRSEGDPAHALFWQGAPGRYRDVTELAALATPAACRAAHGADLDGDGDLDLLLGCRDGVRALRNDLVPPGRARVVRLRGTLSTPDGLHARLTTPSGEVRLVRGGGQPYAGGLEAIDVAGEGELVVGWPSGLSSRVEITPRTPPELVLEEPALLEAPRTIAPEEPVPVVLHPIRAGARSVEVEAVGASWTEPLAPGPDGTYRGILAPVGAPTEIVLRITLDGRLLAARPRVRVR